MERTEVAIIGAGPYGLAAAAHLRAKGLRYRIFGVPMHSWRAQMPVGMFLKSEGFASNISDPDRRWTLQRYCERNGIPYAPYGWPIPLQVFVDYGLDFQRHNALDVQETRVSRVERNGAGYILTLDGGERLSAKSVIVAFGLSEFSHVPKPLSELPAGLVTHSGDIHDYAAFKGRSLCIVGSGASATDAAAAAQAAGAHVHLVARRKTLLWIARRTRKPVFEAWHMRDVLGAGRMGQGHFYSEAPGLFRHLPRRTRIHIVRTFLGPRGGWPVRACVDRLPKSLGFTPEHAEIRSGRIHLRLRGANGVQREIETDHVIAGTGYKVDFRKVSFLPDEIVRDLKLIDGYPALSANFESSLPGLFFAGVSAAYTFGPLMRFVAGTEFAAQRIARHAATVV